MDWARGSSAMSPVRLPISRKSFVAAATSGTSTPVKSEAPPDRAVSSNNGPGEFDAISSAKENLHNEWYTGTQLDLIKDLLGALQDMNPQGTTRNIEFVEKKLINLVEKRELHFLAQMTAAFKKELSQQTAAAKAIAQECKLRMKQSEDDLDKLRLRFNRRQLGFEQQRKELLKQLLHLRHILNRFRGGGWGNERFSDDVAAFESAADDFLREMRHESADPEETDLITMLRKNIQRAELQLESERKAHQEVAEANKRLQLEFESRREILAEMRSSKREMEKQIAELQQKLQEQSQELVEAQAKEGEALAEIQELEGKNKKLEERIKLLNTIRPRAPLPEAQKEAWWEEGEVWGQRAIKEIDEAVKKEREGKPIPLTAAETSEALSELHEVYQSPVLYGAGEALAQLLVNPSIRMSTISALQRSAIMSAREEGHDANVAMEADKGAKELEDVFFIKESSVTEEASLNDLVDESVIEEEKEDVVEVTTDTAAEAAPASPRKPQEPSPKKLVEKRSHSALLTLVDGKSETIASPRPRGSAAKTSPPKASSLKPQLPTQKEEQREPRKRMPKSTEVSARTATPGSSEEKVGRAKSATSSDQQDAAAATASVAGGDGDVSSLQQKIRFLEERMKGSHATARKAQLAIEAEAKARKELQALKREVRSARIDASQANDKRVELEKQLQAAHQSATQWRMKALAYEDEIKSLKNDLQSNIRTHRATLRQHASKERRSSMFSSDDGSSAQPSSEGANGNETVTQAAKEVEGTRDSAAAAHSEDDDNLRPLSAQGYRVDSRSTSRGPAASFSSVANTVDTHSSFEEEGSCRLSSTRGSRRHSGDYETVPATTLKISSAARRASDVSLPPPTSEAPGAEPSQQLLKGRLAAAPSSFHHPTEAMGASAAATRRHSPPRTSRGSVILGRAPFGQVDDAAPTPTSPVIATASAARKPTGVFTKSEAVQQAKALRPRSTSPRPTKPRRLLSTPVGLVVPPKLQPGGAEVVTPRRSMSPLRHVDRNDNAKKTSFYQPSPRHNTTQLPNIRAVKSFVLDDSTLPPTPSARRSLPPSVLERLNARQSQPSEAPPKQSPRATNIALALPPLESYAEGSEIQRDSDSDDGLARRLSEEGKAIAGSEASDGVAAGASEELDLEESRAPSPITARKGLKPLDTQMKEAHAAENKEEGEEEEEEEAPPTFRSAQSFSTRSAQSPRSFFKKSHTFAVKPGVVQGTDGGTAAADGLGALLDQPQQAASRRLERQQMHRSFRGAFTQSETARLLKTPKAVPKAKPPAKPSKEEVIREETKKIGELEEEKRQLVLENARLHVVISNLSRDSDAYTWGEGGPPVISSVEEKKEEGPQQGGDMLQSTTHANPVPVVSITIGPAALVKAQGSGAAVGTANSSLSYPMWDTKEIDEAELPSTSAINLTLPRNEGFSEAAQEVIASLQEAMVALVKELQRWRRRTAHLAQRVEALETYVEKQMVHTPEAVQPRKIQGSSSTAGPQEGETEETPSTDGAVVRPPSWLQPLHSLRHAEWYRSTVRGIHHLMSATGAPREASTAVVSPTWALESLGHAAVTFRRHTWKADRCAWLHMARSLLILRHLKNQVPTQEEWPLSLRTLFHRKEPIAAALRRHMLKQQSANEKEERVEAEQRREEGSEVKTHIRFASSDDGSENDPPALAYHRPLALAELLSLAFLVRAKDTLRTPSRGGRAPSRESSGTPAPTPAAPRPSPGHGVDETSRHGREDSGQGKPPPFKRAPSTRSAKDRPGRFLRVAEEVRAFRFPSPTPYHPSSEEAHYAKVIWKVLRWRRQKELAALRNESHRILRSLLGTVALCLSELPYPLFALHSKGGGDGYTQQPRHGFTVQALEGHSADVSSLPRISLLEAQGHFMDASMIHDADSDDDAHSNALAGRNHSESEDSMEEPRNDAGETSNFKEARQPTATPSSPTTTAAAAVVTGIDTAASFSTGPPTGRARVKRGLRPRGGSVIVAGESPRKGRGRSLDEPTRPTSKGLSAAGSRALGIPLSGRHTSPSPSLRMRHHESAEVEYQAYPARITRFYDREAKDILAPRSVDEQRSVQAGFIVPRVTSSESKRATSSPGKRRPSVIDIEPPAVEAEAEV